MIYVLTYAMLMPGTELGYISDLYEDAFLEAGKAERAFQNLKLTQEYFRKELWVKDSTGKRRLLKEERYKGEAN